MLLLFSAKPRELNIHKYDLFSCAKGTNASSVRASKQCRAANKKYYVAQD